MAVAVGVGVAAATGVASAETDASDTTKTSSSAADSSSESSTTSGPDSASTGSTTTKTTTAKSAPEKSDDADDTEAEDSKATKTDDGTPPAETAKEETAATDTEETVADETPADTSVEGPAETPAQPVDEVPEQEPATDDPSTDEAETPVAGGAESGSSSSGSGGSDRAKATSTKDAETSTKTKTKTESQTKPDTETEKSTQKTVADDTDDSAPAAAATTSTVSSLSATSGTDSSLAAATTVTEPAAPKNPLLTAIKTVGGIVQKALTGFMGAMGFEPYAANGTTQPTGIAAFVALLGWGARRQTTEPEYTQLTDAEVAMLVASNPTAAAAATPTTTWVGWVTGANSINDTKARFGIAGTDVGIMWDNGVTGDDPNTAIVEKHQVLIAFGDTFSQSGMTGVWRSNVLLRSADNVLSDGISVPDGVIHDPGAYSGSPMTIPNFAREIIGKYPYSKAAQVTVIPTGGISVAGAGVNGATRQYAAVMSIKSWDTPGSWTTNYSGIIYSDDNGQNWTVMPKSSIRSPANGRSTVAYVSGNQNFQMISFVKPPEGSADAEAGYVYAYGTPAGRNGTVYLSRVNENQILDVSKYEYWDGKKWTANKPSAAKPVLPGTTKTYFGFFKKTTYPKAGELSVQYNTYLNKYVMLNTDQYNNVVMRTADSPTGTWSEAKTLAYSLNYPGLYAPMIHPWSGTDQLKKADGSAEDPQYLYWNMSLWGDYNVVLMKTDLSRV